MTKEQMIKLDYKSKANRKIIKKMLKKLKPFETEEKIDIGSLEVYYWKIVKKTGAKIFAIMPSLQYKYTVFCKDKKSKEFQFDAYTYTEMLEKFIVYSRYNKVYSNE